MPDAGAAVVLLSGGLDSATAAAWAVAQGWDVHALSIDYGQRHAVELEFAAQVAARLGLASHRSVLLPVGSFGGSALTDAAIAVPKQAPDPKRIPITYVPARNLTFLALAAGLAEVVGAHTLVVGANAIDYSGYPDCRRPFFDAVETALNLGTKSGAEGIRWRIATPLIDLSKAAIIRMGLELGVPYEWTSSCYDPGSDGRPCGACESCRIRAAGFAAAGTADPLLVRLDQ